MSMRVQYTIPGIDYQGPVEVAEFAPPIAEPDRPQSATWRDVLGLSRPQPGDLVLPPPPKPATISYSDAAETRRQWIGLMQRHPSANAASEAEGRMLDTLAWLRNQEDDLQARILAEPKE